MWLLLCCCRHGYDSTESYRIHVHGLLLTLPLFNMECATTDHDNQLVGDCDNHESANDVQNHTQASTSGSPLRRGKWTAEEETYALAAIRDFNSGYLDAPPGTTLRTYLSQALDCDPMRITKKFTGDASIGKKVI